MLLVTGGTGYLGAALVALLVEQGATVRAAIRSPERASVLPSSVELIRADMSDEDALARAMAGCEGVFHLAASLGTSPAETREYNVEGTRRVLRAAMRAGVRRVVYTSSSAAIIDASGLVSERTTSGTALVDPYSTTKAEAEQLVFAAVRDGLDANIVNVVNAYGPSPRGPESYNRLIRAALTGELETIVNATVGWVLAEDVARGHQLAYERGEAGRRYVLCGEIAPFPVFLGRAAELWGTPYQVQTLPPGTTLADGVLPIARRSEVYGRLGPVHVDDAQARAIGFRPRGIDEGLHSTMPWLRTFA